MTGGTIVRRAAPARMAYWQALDSGRILLMAAAAMLVVAAFAGVVALHPAHVNFQAALAFGGLIAFGELFRLALPGGREAAPIAMVGAMAYAMLFFLPSGDVSYDALMVVAVAAVGMAVGALPHIAAGRSAGLTGMCTRLVAVSCVAFIFRPIVSAGIGHMSWEFQFSVVALVFSVGWLVDTLVGALIRADDVGARFSVAMRDEMRLQWPLGLAVGASVLIAIFGVMRMGLLELAVFIGPLLVTQLAFRRYAGIRATYLQTVRSLARVTEVAGYVEAGHSRRVSRLAVAVGRGLGLAEPELLALEYAALMHDIGQLSLRDPIPGGATLLVSPADQERIAELGAEVIRTARVLDDVAELVRYQSRPARGHVPPPPLGSMIIKAANAFDDMVGSSTDRNRSAAALEQMRLSPVEYDAGVVAVLAEVAGRRVPSRL
ncbi:MAG TPA: HD domain-containing phosphohydrolase [Streptosporangiaceae bacterium]|nr:HD domain-containing phosphohydrolase [Streptosporangiaceae bacterium]